MDQIKTGNVIRELRIKEGMTQRVLAEKLRVSDRAISKWERGLGCPDVSLLTELSKIFRLDLVSLLDGELKENEETNGNLKKTKLYYCPTCKNIVLSSSPVKAFCCSHLLDIVEPEKKSPDMDIEINKGSSVVISSEREQRKDDYASLVLYLTSDSYIIKRLYPEWGINIEFPYLGHGKLIWERNGSFYYTLI